MRLPRLLFVGVFSSLLAITTSAQQAPLTNTDIVKMFKAGLSESIVISAIKAAPTAVFELNPDALIKLKGDGVSDAALAAMMAKASGVSQPAAPNPSVTGGSTTALEVVVPENTELTLRLVRTVTSANARVEDKVDLE